MIFLKLSFFAILLLFPGILLADPIIEQYLGDKWLATEITLEARKKIDDKKYNHISFFKYGEADFYAIIFYGKAQYSKYLQGFCFSEVKMSYFYGGKLDEVNFQDHSLGWVLHRSAATDKGGCDEYYFDGKKIYAIGDLSFSEIVYVVNNFKKIGKKVSSKYIDCSKKDIELIFSYGFGDVELIAKDSSGKEFSLLLERNYEKLRPIECTEIF